jgi:competence protein ComEC
MRLNLRKQGLFFFFIFLLLVAVILIWIDWQNSHREFSFTMLDVGQGDALFVESPSGTQVLIDSGPPQKILGKLSQVMSPFDRKIDALIITNPDLDHIGGLSDVLKFYKVGKVFESSTWNDSKVYQNLENEIKNKDIPNILAEKGMKLNLGGGVVIDILFPDRDVTNWPTNDGSIVAKLSYRNFSLMLLGDATAKTEKIILQGTENSFLKSDILKTGHHGSRTSTSEEFFRAVSPEIALISAGKNNKYGHPHQEILNLFSKFGVKVFRTDEVGTISLKCDKMGKCKINK